MGGDKCSDEYAAEGNNGEFVAALPPDPACEATGGEEDKSAQGAYSGGGCDAVAADESGGDDGGGPPGGEGLGEAAGVDGVVGFGGGGVDAGVVRSRHSGILTELAQVSSPRGVSPLAGHDSGQLPIRQCSGQPVAGCGCA